MFSKLLRLSKQSIIYGFGVVVSQAVGFLLLPLYTRYLTLVDYGTLEIFTTTQGLLSIIFILGLTTAMFMSYFSYQDEQSKNKVVSTTLLFIHVTSLCFTLFLLILANNFSLWIFNSPNFSIYFHIVFLTLFFDTAVIITMQVFRAKEEPNKYVVTSLFRLLLNIGLNIYFVVVVKKGILGILISNLITAMILYCILIPITFRRTGFKFCINDMKKMLKYGLPLVPGGLGTWIMNALDRYFLQFLSTTTALGLYSIGYKFGMAIQLLIVGPFTLAWAPFYWSTFKEKNAQKIYANVLTYFFAVSIFVALSISVLSREILIIMTTPSFYDAYKVIPLIALSYVLYGCYHILSVGFNLKKKTKYVPFIVGTGALTNIGLNLLLIPNYGMMGAGVATVISYLLLPFGSYLVSQKYYPINYEWGRIIKIFIAALIVYIGSLFIINDSAILASILKLFSILGFPILLYLFRFFKDEETRKVKHIFNTVYTKLRSILF